MRHQRSATTIGTMTSEDEAQLSDIPLQMIEAWNRGDAEAFAAPFSETADFIAFEGTHLHGRSEIAAGVVAKWAGILSFGDLGGICRDTCDDSRPDAAFESG
jgi:hypothetical protein